MRIRFLSLTLAACLMITGCATKEKRVVPASNTSMPTRVLVVPDLTTPQVVVFSEGSDFVGSGATYIPALAYLADVSVERTLGLVRDQRANRVRAVFDTAFAGSNLATHFTSIIEPLPAVAGAELEVRSMGTLDVPLWDLAARRMTASNADAYIAVDSAYRLTPDRDQLVVTVLMQTFLKRETGGRRDIRGASAHLSRRYTYMSPRLEVAPRPFRDGEKQRIAESVRAQYEADMAAAEDPETLQQALDRELAELELSETVPEDVLLAEAWSHQLGRTFLAQAAAHLRLMIEADWSDNGFAADPGPEERIRVSSGPGLLRSQSAVRLDATATHAIMRSTGFGNLYAVPLNADRS